MSRDARPGLEPPVSSAPKTPVRPASEQSSLRRLAPPKPLALLLAIVVIVGLAWALTVAPWQSPDEPAHFAYAQSLAENFKLPGAAGRNGMSSDQIFADGEVGASHGAFWPEASPPNWSKSGFAAYLATERSRPPSKSDGSGPLPVEANPPLYYLFADIGYLIDHGGTTFGRLYSMRLSGVLLLALSTIAAWLLAGEALGRRRLAQLACAAFVGLLPMSTFMSTNINPDALLITTWSFALWLGARVINRRAQTMDAIALCAVTAAAILTKATSYALLVGALFALFVGWRRRPAAERRPALWGLAAAGVVLLAPIVGWLTIAHFTGRPGVNQIGTSGAHPFNVGQFLSYVWQFYLPRLPFLTPFRTTPQLPVYDIWLNQGIGIFGWLDVYLPHWLYPVTAWVLGGIAIVAIALLTRLHDRRQLALLGFFVLTAVALLGLLHITEYRAVIAGSGTFLQGRYLLPVIGLGGLSLATVVTALPPRARAPACGLTLTVLLALQVISLSSVVRAYYL